VVFFRYFLTDFKHDKGKTSQVIKSIVDMFAIAVSMQSPPFQWVGCKFCCEFSKTFSSLKIWFHEKCSKLSPLLGYGACAVTGDKILSPRIIISVLFIAKLTEIQSM
jgi:hypothetical protein